jgi:hypothetical protein
MFIVADVSEQQKNSNLVIYETIEQNKIFYQTNFGYTPKVASMHIKEPDYLRMLISPIDTLLSQKREEISKKYKLEYETFCNANDSELVASSDEAYEEFKNKTNKFAFFANLRETKEWNEFKYKIYEKLESYSDKDMIKIITKQYIQEIKNFNNLNGIFIPDEIVTNLVYKLKKERKFKNLPSEESRTIILEKTIQDIFKYSEYFFSIEKRAENMKKYNVDRDYYDFKISY